MRARRELSLQQEAGVALDSAPFDSRAGNSQAHGAKLCALLTKLGDMKEAVQYPGPARVGTVSLWLFRWLVHGISSAWSERHVAFCS